MSRRAADLTKALVATAILATVAIGCGSAPGASDASPGASASVRPGPSLGPRPTVGPSDAPVTGEVPGPIMEAVLAEVGELAGTDPSGATIVQAEAVEWSDGALGCPEPGMLYPQVITPGYQVVVELDGTRYDLRVAREGAVIRLCEGLAPAGG